MSLPPHLEIHLQKMRRFCAYQERSCFEIEQKLTRLGLVDSEIKQTLDCLKAENFINQSRFIEFYISGKARIKSWGEMKIKHGLRSHRIGDTEINLGLKTHFADKNKTALKQLINKKRSALESETDSYKKQAKIIRFALSKGYTLSDIMSNLS